ncbi:hypothetical protein B0H63DRAFT_260080 [Podospora didyma]|uniref:Apple domain-containing protein n=1 Tax=Podospora didyma TaxID=330526 RepID=A0AAE0KDM0_9PEZI|nr:hypothetical protein B0H63DRAFT_260080 [Podospora didyma]
MMGSRRATGHGGGDDASAAAGLEMDIGQGIELAQPKRPQFQEQDANPGIEVMEHSNLEVVAPRQGLSQSKTWEKTSGLPETHVVAYNIPATATATQPVFDPHSPYGGGGHGHDHFHHQQQHHLHNHSNPNVAYAGGVPGASPYSDYSTITTPYGFASPFDKQPLVPPTSSAGGGNGGGGGGGIGGSLGGAGHWYQRERICGLKRQTFLVVLVIGIFLAVVGIAAGVGVGVATRKSSDTSTSPPPAATTTPPSPSTTSAAGLTIPKPTAQANTNTNQPMGCPRNNLTLYTSPFDSTRKFELLCGRDYNSDKGTLDMYHSPTDTMDECIDLCAAQPGCVGAGWGDQNGKYSCWLKSHLAEPGWAPLWAFAVLSDVDGKTSAFQ